MGGSLPIAIVSALLPRPMSSWLTSMRLQMSHNLLPAREESPRVMAMLTSTTLPQAKIFRLAVANVCERNVISQRFCVFADVTAILPATYKIDGVRHRLRRVSSG